MKTTKFIAGVQLVALTLCGPGLDAQDRYPVRRITTHPAQEGFPAWSPDGRTIVYSLFTRDDSAGITALWKVPSEGGDARQFTRVVGEHPDWSPDGHYVVFDGDEGSAVRLVAATGGQPVRLVPASIAILGGGLPKWSPDGGRIAFKDGTGVRILDVRTGESSVLFAGPDSTVPLPGSWARDGNDIYVTVMHRRSYVATIWCVSVEGGKPRRLTFETDRRYRYVDLSPDGALLVITTCEGRDCDLWVMPAAGGQAIQLTSGPATDDGPRWSPDGTSIAFASTRSGGFDVWVMDVDVEDLRAAVAAANR